MISRDQLIAVLRERFDADPSVLAMWLEGADASGRIDGFSDIDLIVDVKDGEEERVLGDAEAAQATLGSVDVSLEVELAHPKLRHKVFHVDGSSEFLLVDFVVQSHSRAFRFVRQNSYERPYVLFDKADVVAFVDFDQPASDAETRERLAALEATFSLQSRVRKYVKRDAFLEALAYYRKYVLDPVIELLRIRYTPLIRDHSLVHISDQLPEPEVRTLEDLHRVTSASEIGARLEAANAVFVRVLADVKQHYGAE